MILNGDERERERALILGGAWPHFPILPVKRDAEHDLDLGLLVWRYVPPERDLVAGPWRVYLANLVEISLSVPKNEKVTWAKALDGRPYIDYANLDEFFEAGWRGD